MSENKCPKCGASIPENKQYCSHCGARLSLVIEAPIIIEEKAKPKKESSIGAAAASVTTVARI